MSLRIYESFTNIRIDKEKFTRSRGTHRSPAHSLLMKWVYKCMAGRDVAAAADIVWNRLWPTACYAIRAELFRINKPGVSLSTFPVSSHIYSFLASFLPLRPHPAPRAQYDT